MNTTINTQSSTFTNKTYYDRTLLESAKTRLVHATFGQERFIPLNSGKRVEFRRWNLFDIGENMCELEEGVTPTGQTLSQTAVEAELSQYGAYVEVSDVFENTAYDRVLNDSAELLGEQIGTVVEWITRDAMCAGNNVQYANGKTSRATVAAADKLTVNEIRKAVRTLKRAKARPFSDTGKKPHFVCICSPEATYDLQSDPLWQDVSKYCNAEGIYGGEIGRLFGIVFVESTESKVFAGEGKDDADVHATLVFGKDAYGVINIDGAGTLETIIKHRGSAGADDPLDQRATVGAKVNGFTVTILNDLWLLRIEHGVSA